MSKELPALLRCLTTGNSDRVSKRLLGIFTEAIKTRPVFKVYGRCDECQKLLRECPTKKDVGLSPTEVMYVMMPPEWSEPIDWEAEGCSERA